MLTLKRLQRVLIIQTVRKKGSDLHTIYMYLNVRTIAETQISNGETDRVIHSSRSDVFFFLFLFLFCFFQPKSIDTLRKHVYFNILKIL